MTTDLDLDIGDGRVRVLRGRAEDRLRDVESGSMDAVVTDPPYGLSREPDIAEVLRHWLAGDDYTHKGGGFMGKSWDSFVPGPSVWREVYRILKPGGHVLCFAGTRTVDLMTIALRMAGFEIRDQIDWLYGSGFPKSHNLHDGWDGWGTALKPAHEPIIMARKPFDGSVASNVSRHGTGAINIDASRVGYADAADMDQARVPQPALNSPTGRVYNFQTGEGRNGETFDPSKGRWPANVILTHAPGCVAVGSKRVKGDGRSGDGEVLDQHNQVYGSYTGHAPHGHADADGTETVEVWECVEGCPVAMLDGQSGEVITGSGVRRNNADSGNGVTHGVMAPVISYGYEDKGGASRFFAQLNYGPWDYDPAWYTAKASKAERNRGLDALPTKVHPWVKHREDAHGGKISEAQERFATMPSQNHHPTVKPVSLMRYLVRLITPPGGTVVDPYMGSGSTGVAGVLEGFAVLGCELDEDEHGEPAGYMEVIAGRVTHALESPGDWEPRPTKARAKPKAAEPVSSPLKSTQDQPKRARAKAKDRNAPPPGWIAANFLEEVV